MNTLVAEDAIFIVGMQMRLIRDTLRLNPPADLFLEKSIDDLCFINHVLVTLSKLINEENSGHGFIDYLLDIEWQFSQLLIEFSVDSSPFSMSRFPDTRDKITSLRNESDARRKALEESFAIAGDLEEPLVSSVELSNLLGSR